MKILFAVLILMFAQSGSAKLNAENGNTITTPSGDVIVMSASKERSVHIVNKENSRSIVVNENKPISLNGKEIYSFKKYRADTLIYADTKIIAQEYSMIYDALQKIINKKQGLPRGFYEISVSNIVINEAGKIVYYQPVTFGAYQYIGQYGYKKGKINIPDALYNEVLKQLTRVIDNSKHTPITIKREAVPYLTYFRQTFTRKI